MKVPASLCAQDINDYTDEGSLRKKKFHADGKKFMRELAQELGISSACEIRSNQGGMAVSGEITLHGDSIYIQLCESMVSCNGPELLFRACKGRKDYTGGRNNFMPMARLAKFPDEQERFLDQCRRLMGVAAHEYA